MRQKIVFLDRGTLKAEVRWPSFEHDRIEHAATASDEVVDRLRGATIAITNKVPLIALALEKLPNLRLIAMATTGYDVIDVDYCRHHGSSIVNVRDIALASIEAMQELADQLIQNIEAFVEGHPRNLVQ